MFKKTFTIIFIFYIVFVTACNNGNVTENRKRPTADNAKIIADTIVYDVMVKNPNPDDNWAKECLRNLDYNALVESVFNMAYSGQYTLYNYFDGQQLNIRDIKQLERKEENIRQNIGKIQFTECWYTKPGNVILEKEIISIVPGKEIIALDGTVRGYKPIFKIQLGK